MPTHSEALLEAYASCPPSARVYHTLEIWQASFEQAVRVVANVGDDICSVSRMARRVTAAAW
jgi:predicted metal-binding protein